MIATRHDLAGIGIEQRVAVIKIEIDLAAFGEPAEICGEGDVVPADMGHPCATVAFGQRKYAALDPAKPFVPAMFFTVLREQLHSDADA